METTVKTSSNTYKIFVGRGLLDDIKAYLPTSFLSRRILIITDQTVEKLYLKKLTSQLDNCFSYAVPSGEDSKCFRYVELICNFLAENGFTRKDCVIALGGGVVGDLAGFVSSIYMRGIPYVQVPTTLLAGIDSSVGGKTAVNLAYGKNLAGRIYPPQAVVFDLDTLNTLPENYVRDGIGEGLKYALLEGEELFEKMENGIENEKLEGFVDACIGVKKRIVEQDENEASIRKLLNLGHTVGHSIERESELTITHGVCVSIGLRVVVNACFKNGYLKEETYKRIVRLLDKYCVPDNLYPIADLIENIKVDKKTDGGNVDFISVHDIGDCRITSLPIDGLKEFLE